MSDDNKDDKDLFSDSDSDDTAEFDSETNHNKVLDSNMSSLPTEADRLPHRS